MIARSLAPFLVSYGAGHAEIMIRVARELRERGHSPTILGLTTAYAQFRRAGLDALDVTALLRPRHRRFLQEARSLSLNASHPDVSGDQSVAYFAIGLADLADQHGDEEARSIVEELGRKAFLPIRTFEEYFEATRPDVVVTTTSPRFELAAARAARRAGVPSLAVADLFLIHERKYVADPSYADAVALLCEQVRIELGELGMEPRRLHVTGNPAFDALADPLLTSRRGELRARLGFDNEDRVVLWPGAASQRSPLYERHCLNPDQALYHLEEFCVRTPAWRYIFRPHPNAPLPDGRVSANGLVDSSLTAYEALIAADGVVVELAPWGSRPRCSVNPWSAWASLRRPSILLMAWQRLQRQRVRGWIFWGSTHRSSMSGGPLASHRSELPPRLWLIW